MLHQHLHIMSSLERLEVLNTPERLMGRIDVGPLKGPTGPQETEPPESLSLSRTGLTRVADSILKNSSLKVSLGVFSFVGVILINA